MNKRVEAIHFCLAHDDGTKISEYDEADVILLGVSRAGKTPVAVYLATQMGLKSANFPLTAEYLNRYKVPEIIRQNLSRTVALTTSPVITSYSIHYTKLYDDRTTGAEFDGNVITLHFVDGERGDHDLTADGIIDDPGGPAFVSTGSYNFV